MFVDCQLQVALSRHLEAVILSRWPQEVAKHQVSMQKKMQNVFGSEPDQGDSNTLNL